MKWHSFVSCILAAGSLVVFPKLSLAYSLIPETSVRITQDDHLNGMLEIRLGGITKPLWTYMKFLSAGPIRDTYGIVETPDKAGLVDPGDTAAAGSALNERRPRGAP
jgi:hypothetical protein